MFETNIPDIMASQPLANLPLKDWEHTDKLNAELIGYGWLLVCTLSNAPL